MFDISHFNPFVGKRKKIIAEPLTVDPNLFYMEWTRGPLLKETDGAENYWLSSQQLPKYSLSGALPINARFMNISLPAPAPLIRRFPNATIGASGILNGQIFSQPLYDENTAGYVRSMYPINPLPFASGLFNDDIQPGGVA